MRLFDSLEHFREVTAGTRKWERTLEAVDAARDLPAGVAWSIGDSLTYRSGSPEEFATDHLVGRRRYHQVIAATGGEVLVEIAPKEDLAELSGYDDLSDRQPFSGEATTVTVPTGGILVVGIDEAARVLASPAEDPARVIVELHVTVEGATFHNK